MSRVLVVVPPLVGHVNPTLPFGAELSARGHEVAWAGYPEVLSADLVADWGEFLPVAQAMSHQVTEDMATNTRAGVRGPAGFKASTEQFILPIARQMLAGVHRAVEQFQPDVLVVDQQAPAGVAVAELRRIPWVTSATTPAELGDPLAAGLPKVASWQRDVLTDLLIEAGLDRDRATEVDPRFSPWLVLAFTAPELLPPGLQLPEHYAVVGPSIGARPEPVDFDWEWLERGRGPVVLVSLGTVNWQGGARFFAAVSEAVASSDLRAVAVTTPEFVPDPPPNLLVASRVPQIALLGKVDAVVTHGGHNTVCEALEAGKPMVVAPIRDDQPFIADRVVHAGAGVRLKFSRITAVGLREALDEVLGQPAYRNAAARIGASFAELDGPGAAADRLDRLLATTPTAHAVEGR